MAATANLVAFPRADLRGALGAALKRHRLPELPGQRSWCAKPPNFPDVSADAALAFALARRMTAGAYRFRKRPRHPAGRARAAPAKAPSPPRSLHAAALVGRKTRITRADGGLALFRTGTNPPDLLTVMEADGFNPLNARAAAPFPRWAISKAWKPLAWFQPSAMPRMSAIWCRPSASAASSSPIWTAPAAWARPWRRDHRRRRLAHVTPRPPRRRCAGNPGTRRLAAHAAGRAHTSLVA